MQNLLNEYEKLNKTARKKTLHKTFVEQLVYCVEYHKVVNCKYCEAVDILMC